MKSLLTLLFLCSISWSEEKHQLLIIYPDIPEMSKNEFRIKTEQSFRENALLSKIQVMRIKIIRSEQKPNKDLETMALLIETDVKCDPNNLMNALSKNWPKVLVIGVEDFGK